MRRPARRDGPGTRVDGLPHDRSGPRGGRRRHDPSRARRLVHAGAADRHRHARDGRPLHRRGVLRRRGVRATRSGRSTAARSIWSSTSNGPTASIAPSPMSGSTVSCSTRASCSTGSRNRRRSRPTFGTWSGSPKPSGPRAPRGPVSGVRVPPDEGGAAVDRTTVQLDVAHDRRLCAPTAQHPACPCDRAAAAAPRDRPIDDHGLDAIGERVRTLERRHDPAPWPDRTAPGRRRPPLRCDPGLRGRTDRRAARSSSGSRLPGAPPRRGRLDPPPGGTSRRCGGAPARPPWARPAPSTPRRTRPSRRGRR